MMLVAWIDSLQSQRLPFLPWETGFAGSSFKTPKRLDRRRSQHLQGFVKRIGETRDNFVALSSFSDIFPTKTMRFWRQLPPFCSTALQALDLSIRAMSGDDIAVDG